MSVTVCSTFTVFIIIYSEYIICQLVNSGKSSLPLITLLEKFNTMYNIPVINSHRINKCDTGSHNFNIIDFSYITAYLGII